MWFATKTKDVEDQTVFSPKRIHRPCSNCLKWCEDNVQSYFGNLNERSSWSFEKIADLISSSLHFDRILRNNNGKPSNLMILRSRGGDFLKNCIPDVNKTLILRLSIVGENQLKFWTRSEPQFLKKLSPWPRNHEIRRFLYYFRSRIRRIEMIISLIFSKTTVQMLIKLWYYVYLSEVTAN